MKIRFPKIEYSVQIHPKPRGNWRPRVDFYLRIEVPKGACSWRPYLTGIGFVARKSLEEYPDCFKEYAIINGIKVYKSISFCMYDCGIIEDKLKYKFNRNLPRNTLIVPCDKVFDSPERGEGRKYNILYIEWDTYLNEGMEFIHRATFWLPWRPSIKPDYSDFGRAFSVIPRLLYEMLQDGLDSGTSQKIEVSFVGCLGMAKQQEQEEKDKEEIIFV